MITTIILLAVALLVALYTIRIHKREKYRYGLMVNEYKLKNKKQRLELRELKAQRDVLNEKFYTLMDEIKYFKEEEQTNADEELADLIKNSYDAI